MPAYYRTPNGIPYEELQGSPKFSASESGLTATQIVRVAWNNLPAFIDECHPQPKISATGKNITPNPKTFPGYNWLFANSLEAEPFDENDPATQGVFFNQYARLGARVTITYAAKQLTPHRVTIGGEVLKLPNTSLLWNSGAKVQDEDLVAGRILPTLEHTFTFRNVLSPPWTNIANRLGKVNSNNEIDDGVNTHSVTPETVLFLGCDAEEERDTEGGQRWHLTYRFSERAIYDDATRITWNHFWNKETNGWEKLKDANGNPIYALADFDELFKESGDEESESSA